MSETTSRTSEDDGAHRNTVIKRDSGGHDGFPLTISVPGTFWAFRIAREVAGRGGNVCIYTSDPEFIRSANEASATVHTIRHPFFVKQVGYQIPQLNRLLEFTGYNRPFERWGNYIFDSRVASRLNAERPGLFLGFAGACRNSLRQANELSYVTAVERSSTHIRTQRNILREEYERYGVEGQPISLQHVEREEQEYREADYIVTPSEFTAKTFLDNGVAERKLLRIPFGTDVDFDPPDRESNSKFSVLFAGHASLRKGIQYLLPAWDELSLSNAELVIAGNVEDAVSDLVEQYEDDDSIRFLGWVDDVASLYRNASALVLPTLEEGSARVTYEAMAWELPIITTPHSGWVGSDEEHGIEVPIREVSQLADAIKLLYEDEELRRDMGRNGRGLMESEYTWDDYGSRVWTAYQQMYNSAH